MYNIFGTRSTPSHTLNYCKLYDTTLKGECTKIQLDGSLPSTYEFLKKASHPNIMPIYKITNKSVYTKHVRPLIAVYEPDKTEYNKYIIIKIGEALDYIHNELKKQHNSVEMDAIFIDDRGGVLLGKFHNVTEFESEKTDRVMLDRLSKELTGRLSKQYNKPAVVFQLLDKPDLLKTNDMAQKRIIIQELIESKSDLTSLTLRNAISILINELSTNNDTNYKIYTLDSLFKMDSNLINNEYYKELFAVLDSSVRMYLLKNIGSVSDLNTCISEICLGLYVKDKIMRLETVNYIFEHCASISWDGLAHTLNAMKEIKENETVGLICQKLAMGRAGENKIAEIMKNPALDKAVYNLLLRYAQLGRSRASVYACIEEHFMRFNKTKLCIELLPQLCSRLCDDESQEKCFLLVDKILGFLRQHRGEIHAKDWSLKSIKNMLIKKKNENEDKVECRISKIGERETDKAKGWDEEDIVNSEVNNWSGTK